MPDEQALNILSFYFPWVFSEKASFKDTAEGRGIIDRVVRVPDEPLLPDSPQPAIAPTPRSRSNGRIFPTNGYEKHRPRGAGFSQGFSQAPAWAGLQPRFRWVIFKRADGWANRGSAP